MAAGEADAGRPKRADDESALRPTEPHALEALRWDWDTAYIIGHDDENGWYAGRRDKIGDLITAGDPDELRREIAEDYALKPVAREPAPRAKADGSARVLGADAGELLTESAEP